MKDEGRKKIKIDKWGIPGHPRVGVMCHNKKSLYFFYLGENMIAYKTSTSYLHQPRIELSWAVTKITCKRNSAGVPHTQYCFPSTALRMTNFILYSKLYTIHWISSVVTSCDNYYIFPSPCIRQLDATLPPPLFSKSNSLIKTKKLFCQTLLLN